MNAKMTAFKCIVQCYKCNCLLIKEIEKTVIFQTRKAVIMQKTCHFLDNLDNIPKQRKLFQAIRKFFNCTPPPPIYQMFPTALNVNYERSRNDGLLLIFTLKLGIMSAKHL